MDAGEDRRDTIDQLTNRWSLYNAETENAQGDSEAGEGDAERQGSRESPGPAALDVGQAIEAPAAVATQAGYGSRPSEADEAPAGFDVSRESCGMP